MKNLIVFLLCLLLLFGCSGNSDDSDSTSDAGDATGDSTGDSTGDATEDSNSFIGYNNSAILSGPSVGRGTVANSTMYKPAQVTITTTNGFSISNPLLIIYDESSDAEMIVTITNNNSEAYCPVSFGTMKVYDSSGDIISTNRGQYVRGSVGITTVGNNSYASNTCLAAGESGVSTISAHYFHKLSHFVYEYIDGNSIVSLADPKGKVIPQSYDVEKGYYDRVKVTAKNEGTGTAYLTAGSSYYLISSEDEFVYRGSLTAPSNRALEVGQSVELSGMSRYCGSASKMLVIMDFEDSSGDS